MLNININKTQNRTTHFLILMSTIIRSTIYTINMQ